jgi:hypothetical protein
MNGDVDEGSENELDDDTQVVVMQIVCLTDGTRTAFDGQYVVEYDPGRDGVDPTGRPMLCYLRTTPRVQDATRFTGYDALELWRAVDPRQPTRPDGRPNRPLTAFTVSIAAPGVPPITDVLDPKGRI